MKSSVQMMVEFRQSKVQEKAEENEAMWLALVKARRAKMEKSYKKKKGPYSDVPDWIEKFENEMRISMETMNEKFKKAQHKQKTEL